MTQTAIDRCTIRIGSESLRYVVSRSDRLRASILVRPSSEVEVRVPLNTPDDWISGFVQRRARWIIRQRTYFEQFKPRDPARRYVSGETIRYLGRQYRLKITRGVNRNIKLHGRFLQVTICKGETGASAGPLVHEWYKARAHAVFGRRMESCVDLMRPHGIKHPPLILRPMKRRWGSCTPKRRILLNPMLVMASVNCIDYVIIHELCHLVHPRHDGRFYRLLATVLPDWERARSRLESTGRHLTV